MIFVTVGTHEQQFNRLVECVDKLVESGEIEEEVFIQYGYSTYIPKRCKGNKLLAYEDMVNLLNQADIVITHGGPASFISALQCGKIPVVVPRQKKFGEHVNNHQLEFCKQVESRQKNIIVVEDVATLGDVIKRYGEICKNLTGTSKSNNAKFNEEFKKIVYGLMG